MQKIKCQRFKTTVDPDVACVKQCPHKATCSDYRVYLEQPPETQEEEPVGDGQSHGAEESREPEAPVARRVDPNIQKMTGANKAKIKHKLVTFVETAPGSGLFRLEDITLPDLITINLADRRVIAAAEATEF